MTASTLARSINVFSCESLLSSNQQQKAARASLFGPNTVLREGGWSYYDRDSIENAVITPTRVKDLETAKEVGLSFMEQANQKFTSKGGSGELFPLNKSLFKLEVAEQLLYQAGDAPKAWKVTWAIFANPGGAADIPVGSGPWPHISNSHISLVIELSGRVLGGDASWRPVKSTLSAKQLLTSTDIIDEINTARSAQQHSVSESGDAQNSEHAHADQSTTANADSPASNASLAAALVYRNASPAEFRNFIDPHFFLIEQEGEGHSHGPQLEIPATEYGIAVNLLKTISSTTGEGEVMLEPWVVTAEGDINLATAGSEYHVHWTVRRFGDPDPKNIKYYKSATALRLRGLYEVSLTVRTEKGAIGHAHEFVSSAIGSPQHTNTDDALLV